MNTEINCLSWQECHHKSKCCATQVWMEISPPPLNPYLDTHTQNRNQTNTGQYKNTLSWLVTNAMVWESSETCMCNTSADHKFPCPVVTASSPKPKPQIKQDHGECWKLRSPSPHGQTYTTHCSHTGTDNYAIFYFHPHIQIYKLICICKHTEGEKGRDHLRR